MFRLLRSLLFVLVVKPFVTLVLGVNVRGMDNLPRRGPAVVAANHNSHLDTLVLASLFPLRLLPLLRPVGARDYFLRNRVAAWFSLHIVRLIPLDRRLSKSVGHPLAPCVEALERGEILLIFPEGSRGEPEELGRFKNGVAHLAEAAPDAPVIPVFMRGTGKSLPRGEALLVPHICDLAVGESVRWTGDRNSFMRRLNEAFHSLSDILRPAGPFSTLNQEHSNE